MFLFLISNLSAQTLTLQTNISIPLQESSGLLYLNGKLITHTDSGGEPALYEMDTATGAQTRKVLIQNATNIDWEDITMDADYIYIGDFGNNQGNRINLRIYKISMQDYLSMDTVQADTILFNYADQTDFTPTNFSTNYDAEALINYGGNLYIFTKNWGNLKTYIYPVPKIPGAYSVTKTDSLNAQGYITGAVCDSAQQQILLIGYTFNTSFFIQLTNWTGNQFSSGQVTRKVIQPNSSIQIEGIAQIDNEHYFISSEKFQSTVSQLHILDTGFPTSLIDTETKNNITLYPNPSDNIIYITGGNNPTTALYSSTGQLLGTFTKRTLDLTTIPTGNYFVKIIDNKKVYYKKIQLQ